MMEISVAMQTLADDIDDLIEESDISGTDISEVNDVISRTEDFRTQYRMKHNELNRLAAQSYDDALAEGFNMRII